MTVWDILFGKDVYSVYDLDTLYDHETEKQVKVEDVIQNVLCIGHDVKWGRSDYQFLNVADFLPADGMHRHGVYAIMYYGIVYNGGKGKTMLQHYLDEYRKHGDIMDCHVTEESDGLFSNYRLVLNEHTKNFLKKALLLRRNAS